MDARSIRPGLGLAIVWLFILCSPAAAQFGRRQQFTAHSQNFIVFAASPQWAAQVAEMAELNRKQLAQHWLGSELPPWSERVPVHVEAGEHLGAGGETRFSLIGGNRIGNWMMSVSGTQERILDSVLPHEITHTIFATHFAHLGKYVPRWADEGACTTVEHISEKQKHQQHLQRFLASGRGLAFNRMFSLKEYPSDIMPLYAQGHSAVQFLIDQGGAQKFVKFLEAGMRSEAWSQSLQEFYAYESIGHFQTMWNQWLADGSPQSLVAYAPSLQAQPEAVAGSGMLAASRDSTTGDSTGSTLAVADTAKVPAQFAIANVAPSERLPAQLAAKSVPLSARPASLSGDLTAAADPPALSAQPTQQEQLLAGQASSPTHRGNESWYKRRLREVSGVESPLANTSQHPSPLTAPPAVGGQQAVGRTLPPQSNGIQVLDWGDSEPVPGIQPNLRYIAPPTGMSPIYR